MQPGDWPNLAALPCLSLPCRRTALPFSCAAAAHLAFPAPRC